MTAGRWGLVCVACGPSVLAWIDGGRWRGWLVPWLPDRSMERLGAAYFADAPERAPWQRTSGEWAFTDEDDEVVNIDRHRRAVRIGAAVGLIALSDAGNMAWCWEPHPSDDDPELIAAAVAELLPEFTVTRKKRGGKK